MLTWETWDDAGSHRRPHRTTNVHRFMVVISRIHPLGYLRNNERSKGMRRRPLY